MVLTGLNLRPAVASVPPLVDELERTLGLSSTSVGLLTSLPVLLFGLLAPVAPVLTRRLGAERVLLVALVPIILGILLRAGPPPGALFAGTVLLGAGIAIGNVVVPAVIKGRFERWTGVLMGAYVTGLGVGTAVAAGVTVPAADALGWRTALAIWAIPAGLAAALVAIAIARDGDGLSARGGIGDARTLLRDPLAWQVTTFMLLQSIIFYSALAWLPSVVGDAGFGDAEAGASLSLFALGGIPTALAVPVLATRMRDQRLLGVAVAVLEAAALLGLLAAPGAAYVWVTLFALGQGAGISLALTLMVLRTPNPRRAAELSGMAQSVGYVLAAAGPLALGAARDATGDWDVSLWILVALTVPLLVSGVAAGRTRVVSA